MISPLCHPSGGETIRAASIANIDEQIAAEEEFFHSGECALEVVKCYASGALAVLVAVERQNGHVGTLPPQDWSLRVTLVFRRGERGVAAGSSPRGCARASD